MKKVSLFLILFSFATFSHAAEEKIDNDAKKNENTAAESLKDPRVGEQFIPISKSNEDDIVGYSFLDRKSIKLHPFNTKIRVFSEVTNYSPALVQKNNDGTETPYHSIKIDYYANCDKMELAKGKLRTIENNFGDGTLVNTIEMPNRWVNTNQGSEQYKLLVIGCSLPLAP
ncbi:MULTISPECIES: surface-adhesin E family protein [unclassified Gilliamella]|uniref:surface-adhesin E family protein n=1 Tax=unclassified Gilliamella TaxID=2685620 RepID=UPI00080EB1BE|nr:surface-adhesin E family protein [Gilliamella apicola]OCG61337.1 hypothetical protein A9G40_01195 [Gilliamella apicola]OCG62282.1 hypothetical protein A9G30_09220 [Gilliamella apicola]OCG67188.1 hypothetical protein A9G41_11010 [Gilliamella apicola]OCG75170.1 hypothetical protein A9G42_09135 [Gilliamella apicola]